MMPRQGTLIADRYRLERKVGGGRVSAMWRVQDQVTDSTCAIKLLHRSMNDHPEALARFSLEDRLSRELTGTHFAERVGSGSWHSLRYIAWRWYEGECLRSLFERNPQQDVHTVYSIVQETCQALTIVHGAGYTHGDLKPENLFFAERSEKDKESSRQLKLLGFGVASRLARPLLGAQARRTPGQIVGTPLYMSPDLILGRVPRGGHADLWALSVIVYEALTGRAPFLGSDLAEVLQKILERQSPRPSSITNNLPGTFDLWWQQALEQQFATAAELSASLARALAPALRSSRTQRSASLPDRTAPVLDIVVPRAPSTPNVPVVTARNGRAAAGAASSQPPRGGTTALGMGRPLEATPVVPAAAVPAAMAHARPAVDSRAAPGAFSMKSQPARGARPAAGAEPASSPDTPAAPAASTSSHPGSGEAPAGTVASSAAAVPSPRPAPSGAPRSRAAGARGKALGTSEPGANASAEPGGSTANPVSAAPAGTPAARTPGGNVTSTTVAGIGPAALTMMRALETAAAGATAKIHVAAPQAPNQEQVDRFASVPPQLRDLGVGGRKTLVGIVPPASAGASSLVQALPGLAETTSGSAGAKESLVIAGTPCKSIEVSAGDDPLELPPSIAALRRPGSPTVPFPRPRAAARGARLQTEPEATEPERMTVTQSWHERTGHTLRIVLTDPDHRPHVVAGLVVCAAAALVIFAAGRSRVAGTGALDQTTGSLTAEPGASAAPAAPALTADPAGGTIDESPSSAGASAGGAEAVDGAALDPSVEPARPLGLAGDEVAPGLILPPASRQPGSEPRPRSELPSKPPSLAPLAPWPPATAPEHTTGAAAQQRLAPSSPAAAAGETHSAVPPRAAPQKPGTEPPPPPRPAGGDFDFGI